MNLESFIQRAGNYEILEGWNVLKEVLRTSELDYDELTSSILKIQNKNPLLGNLLYISVRLNDCLRCEVSDGYFSKTLEEFQFLEKFFKDNGLSRGSVVMSSLKEEFPEVLVFLDENCANS